MVAVSPIDGVKGQLQPIRGSHLVEDPKQIVADGVHTQIELVGDVTMVRPSATKWTTPFPLFVSKPILSDKSI